MRVLIAEDNSETRRMIKRVLAGPGVEFVECSNGSEAVALYAGGRPDLVLMDIEMPILDGINTTRQILAADPSARIVILTSHDQPVLREAAQMAGASSYLLKENLLLLRELIEQPTPTD